MMGWLKQLFRNEGRPDGLSVERGGQLKHMREIDPDLLDVIGDMPWNVGITIWCKKYPEDIPTGEQWDWLREAVKH